LHGNESLLYCCSVGSVARSPQESAKECANEMEINFELSFKRNCLQVLVRSVVVMIEVRQMKIVDSCRWIKY
jgi:hypothetical protein